MTSNYSRNLQYTFDPNTGLQTLIRSKAIHEYLGVAPAKTFPVPEQGVSTVRGLQRAVFSG